MRVKLEVLVVRRMLNIHPENIHRKTMLSEEIIAVDYGLSVNLLPLGEVKTKTVCRGHDWIASHVRQQLLGFLWPHTTCEYEEFHFTAFAEEIYLRPSVL